MFPDGTLDEPQAWLHCCVAHDLKYWAGGTWMERLDADKELRDCVIREGYYEMGWVMFLGVRSGGEPTLPTPWRWGYGWSFGRGYRALTDEERALVSALTPGGAQ